MTRRRSSSAVRCPATPSSPFRRLAASLRLPRTRQLATVTAETMHKTATGVELVPVARDGSRLLMRRSYLKEGSVQLTSLKSLLTHRRYLFLFDDLLLIAKENYKLKCKVRLDRLWWCSSSSTESFVIGWPICNYIAHFSCKTEKEDWLTKFHDVCNKYKDPAYPLSTTIAVAVKVGVKQHYVSKRIERHTTALDLIGETVSELRLPAQLHFQLQFESEGDGAFNLAGPERLLAIVLSQVDVTGQRLSLAAMEHIDSCPLIQCRFVLRSLDAKRRSAVQWVNQFRRALNRTDSRGVLFGRCLDNSQPPQPVLTMLDYLMRQGTKVEGIFRKSPKQSSVQALRSKMDQGHVPDFALYSPLIVASLLKDYLRSIPGQLLISSLHELWLERVAKEADPTRRIDACRQLLTLLPAAHLALLRSLLRLLRAIAASHESKMNTLSIAVCIAPNMDDSVKQISRLAQFLIEEAPVLLDGFEDAPLLFSRTTESKDSGLADVDLLQVDRERHSTTSPDSALSHSSPETEMSLPRSPPLSIASEIDSLQPCPDSPNPSLPPLSPTETELSDEDRTPQVSRENSNAQQSPRARFAWKPMAYRNPRKHLDQDDEVGKEEEKEEEAVAYGTVIAKEKPRPVLDSPVIARRAPPTIPRCQWSPLFATYETPTDHSSQRPSLSIPSRITPPPPPPPALPQLSSSSIVPRSRDINSIVQYREVDKKNYRLLASRISLPPSRDSQPFHCETETMEDKGRFQLSSQKTTETRPVPAGMPTVPLSSRALPTSFSSPTPFRRETMHEHRPITNRPPGVSLTRPSPTQLVLNRRQSSSSTQPRTVDFDSRPLEINWSVRQLREQFVDKAPVNNNNNHTTRDIAYV